MQPRAGANPGRGLRVNPVAPRALAPRACEPGEVHPKWAGVGMSEPGQERGTVSGVPPPTRGGLAGGARAGPGWSGPRVGNCDPATAIRHVSAPAGIPCSSLHTPQRTCAGKCGFTPPRGAPSSRTSSIVLPGALLPPHLASPAASHHPPPCGDTSSRTGYAPARSQRGVRRRRPPPVHVGWGWGGQREPPAAPKHLLPAQAPRQWRRWHPRPRASPVARVGARCPAALGAGRCGFATASAR